MKNLIIKKIYTCYFVPTVGSLFTSPEYYSIIYCMSNVIHMVIWQYSQYNALLFSKVQFSKEQVSIKLEVNIRTHVSQNGSERTLQQNGYVVNSLDRCVRAPIWAFAFHHISLDNNYRVAHAFCTSPFGIWINFSKPSPKSFSLITMIPCIIGHHSYLKFTGYRWLVAHPLWEWRKSDGQPIEVVYHFLATT